MDPSTMCAQPAGLWFRNKIARGFGRASEVTFGHVEAISPWSTYIQGKGVRSEGQIGDSHHLPFPRDALEVIHELGDMRVEGHERSIESERRG